MSAAQGHHKMKAGETTKHIETDRETKAPSPTSILHVLQGSEPCPLDHFSRKLFCPVSFVRNRSSARRCQSRRSYIMQAPSVACDRHWFCKPSDFILHGQVYEHMSSTKG